MAKKPRTITITLDADTPADEYAQLANVLWSVAKMSGRLRRVQPDDMADKDGLNNWWAENAKDIRWE